MRVKLVRRNLVRFFKNGNTMTTDKYYDIPIPQMNTVVWLGDIPHRVDDISYSFYQYETDCNMIDLFVSEVSVASLL